jgi:probable HAF family extracellular repeat protein
MGKHLFRGNSAMQLNELFEKIFGSKGGTIMKKKVLLVGVLALVAIFCLMGIGNAAYVMTDLGTLPDATGDQESEAGAINKAGFMVGESNKKGGNVAHAVMWTPGGIISDLGGFIGSPASKAGEAYAINDANLIVGTQQIKGAGFTPFHAFLWGSPGPMKDLGTLPGGTNSTAFGINNAVLPNTVAQIVGVSDSTLGERAFIMPVGGKMKSLGTLPGGSWSSAEAINDRVVVVGQADDSTGQEQAFVWTLALGMRQLPALPGASYCQAHAINNQGIGVIVGESGVPGGENHAVKWVPNNRNQYTIVDLGTLPMGEESEANAINDLGQIVGSSMDALGNTLVVLWSAGTAASISVVDEGSLGGGMGDGSGINFGGVIVGQSKVGAPSPDDFAHAFIAKP